MRFSDLLATAGLLPAARALTLVSDERGYVDSLTLAQPATADAILAHGLEGRPLSRGHGSPPARGDPAHVRIVVVAAADRPVVGYWEQRGYDRNAWLGHSNSFT